MAALSKSLVRPMGDVLVVSRPSDCRTDGETDAPIPAQLFASLLVVNAEGTASLPPGAWSEGVRLVEDGVPPRRLSAERREPVVALSRAGLLGNDALVCVEVFGAEERAFFVLLRRDRKNQWAVQQEILAWRAAPMPWEREPEELPDGELYQPP